MINSRGYVYIARGNGFIKIGFSRDPYSRVWNLHHGATQIPEQGRLEGICVIPGSLDLERSLHTQIERYRITGTTECYEVAVLEDANLISLNWEPFPIIAFHKQTCVYIPKELRDRVKAAFPNMSLSRVIGMAVEYLLEMKPVMKTTFTTQDK